MDESVEFAKRAIERIALADRSDNIDATPITHAIIALTYATLAAASRTGWSISHCQRCCEGH